MKSSWYAEALYAALNDKAIKSEADAKKILARFKKVIVARGHEKLQHFIGQELDKITAREEKNKEILLVTVDEKSQKKWAHAYDHYEKEGAIPKGVAHRSVIDESIVGGFQIRTRDTLIDGSYKKSLIELYRSIIKQN